MPGRVVDLSRPGAGFPDLIVVDTNIIVEFLLASYFVPSARDPRVVQFFQDLNDQGGTGIVTPTVFREFVHVAVRAKYKHELRLMTSHERRSKYGFPASDWLDLYKQDASILQGFLPDLHTLRILLIANGLLFAAPDDLEPIASGRRFDEELVELVGAYGLDSNDAAILLEARQVGLTDIITLDVDMQRAQLDFDIYTWL
jgi:predicted nucleic acid-binding protein